MAYVRSNPKTKKALKDSLKAGNREYAYEPGVGKMPVGGGTVYLEGPQFPEPHRWYASAKVDANGEILSVK